MKLSERAISMLVAELIILGKTKAEIREEVNGLRRDHGMKLPDGPIPFIDEGYEWEDNE